VEIAVKKSMGFGNTGLNLPLPGGNIQRSKLAKTKTTHKIQKASWLLL
jgi:hypothetical protein